MTTDYGHEALSFIPPEMNPWGLQLVTPEPSEHGEFVLIGVEQASIETHHQVEVVDEDGEPLAGIEARLARLELRPEFIEGGGGELDGIK